MRSASPATVPSSKISRTPMSTLHRSRTAATSLVASSEWPPRSKNESSAPTRSRPSSSANSSATRLSVPCAGSRYSAPAPTSGSGSALLSILPCAVIGISSSTTYAAGVMYSGSAAATRARMRSTSTSSTSSAGVRYPTRLLPRFGRSLTTTTAWPTLGSTEIAAATSPSSMRKPRILTCSSARPTNSMSPSALRRARSPDR